jgi:SAM-dependent methyltransferase
MRKSDKPADPPSGSEDTADFAGRTFFSSYYRATAKGRIVDSMTIGTVSEPESRFHYNATENSIIRCLTRRAPIASQTPSLWRFAQGRRAWKVLDVGSGTGHWVDFYLDVYLAKSVTAVEFVPQMAEFLRAKYAGRPEVTVLQADVASDPLPASEFDIVNAIGVMFHIVDDGLWRQAIARLLAALKPDGLLLVGGDFGDETRNVQFHKTDRFDTWDEHDAARATTRLVNKRVRSLSEWTRVAAELGAAIVEVIRSDAAAEIRTPENDLLVMRPAVHAPGREGSR